MQNLWRIYRGLLDANLTTKVFDNVKNLLVCALLFAAGTNALHGDHEVLLGLFVVQLTGWGLIAVSAVLLFLNISDGLHQLAKLRYHIVFQISLFVVYLIISIRVVEVVWSFRSA